MKPILFGKAETNFNTNGIGRLSDATACNVTEVRNGLFEVELKYPVGGIYFDDIKCGNIIFCTTDIDEVPQAFDIYSVSKPNRGIITARGRHISYRLSNIVTMPIAAIGTDAQEIFDLMKSESVGVNPFVFVSDVTTTGSMSVKEPSTIRSILGDEQENQVLYEWQGEYKWDMFTVYHLAARGRDDGVKVRTGKNVKKIEIEGDTSEIVTGVVPWWIGPSDATGDDIYVELPEHILQSSDASLYPYQITKPLDMSDVFESEPTVAELRAAAQEWLDRNIYNTRNRATYKVDMSVITDETADLNKIRLCDLVTVQDAVLNCDIKLKVVKTVWDVLRDRYTQLEIGDLRKTLSYEIKRNNRKIVQRLENVETKTDTIAKTASADGTEAHVEQQLQDSNSALSQAIRKPATTTSVGAVKVGSGLSITQDGTLSATGGGADTGDYWECKQAVGYRHYKIPTQATEADNKKRNRMLSIIPKGAASNSPIYDWSYYDLVDEVWKNVRNNPDYSDEIIFGDNNFGTNKNPAQKEINPIINRFFGQSIFASWITADNAVYPGFIFQRPPAQSVLNHPTEVQRDAQPSAWRDDTKIPHMCIFFDCRLTAPTASDWDLAEMPARYDGTQTSIKIIVAWCSARGVVASNTPRFVTTLFKQT